MKEIIDEIISMALLKRSDDIHILPEGEEYHVFLRDGHQLILQNTFDFEKGSQLIRLLKYMANMDVGEKRMPQDGAMVYDLVDEKIELRLSSISNYLMHESLVIRVFHDKLTYEFESNHLNQEAYDIMNKYMKRKSGLIIFSGPVSSGKTTTIYQLLRNAYQSRASQIITIEEPIEIKEPTFLQTEVNEKADITYDRLLTASLRHHPDIILIGEIRSEETARMVIRASLTGHLVLATVHAKNTFGVIGRLKELGITNEQLVQTLLLVVAQRLLPKTSNSVSNLTEKIALFELLHSEELSNFILNHIYPNNFQSLNLLLKEAYTNGYITKNTMEEYRLETVSEY
ncbi:competence type IV pilus ATPase ComGA [Aerococcus urinaeequi]|uniref:General secretion pathway protein GspE n=1 Tax=Aerococcus viridans TaxID=1377 RepID=A0A2N6UEM2_9LACT|nr:MULTISPECIES: competence type IV pilus ATPase ComGA [Aerococcus]OFU48793.1 general secretion pathway protein GspE [Aerococcus sp. HMSC10H05]PMC79997.1 general secretion pathway protein GspE [Aerococcus viridans]